MYIDEATELESMLLARDPSTIVDEELKEKYWNLREMEDESMKSIEMNDGQMTVRKMMTKISELCEWRCKDAYIDYEADDFCDLNKVISVILFGAKLGDGIWIKSLIEDELSEFIEEISVEKDDDGFAWSYRANIGVYIKFNETISPMDESDYISTGYDIEEY